MHYTLKIAFNVDSYSILLATAYHRPVGIGAFDRVKRSGMRNLLSTILLVVAAALIAVAGYLYYQDRQDSGDLPPPPSVAGQAELKNVFDAVAAEGVDVEYGRENARIDGISTVGQELIVDGESLFVYLFSDPDTREAETGTLTADSIELVDSFGEPLEVEPSHVSTGSNVFAVLTGGSEELVASVDTAIENIP